MSKSSIILLILLVLLFDACKKDVNQFNSKISLTVDTEIEKTTHNFTFQIKPDKPLPSNEKIYVRFDWNSDSVWDTQYSEDLEVNHRFYHPGSYIIKAEFLTKSGFTQTASVGISVERGYSKPKPEFTSAPFTGHFMTNFIFDASQTTDDEDSLSTLKFRWDFYNDGIWDTEFLSSPTTSFKFVTSGKFAVTMDAIDPSSRHQSISHWIDIHRIDTLIQPVLNIIPDNGSVVDTFLFDASESFHLNDPETVFSYSWKFTNEAFSIPSPDSSIIQRIFERPGPIDVTLIIYDELGLENSVKEEFFVSLGNRPPKAFFETPTPYGNINSQIFFSTWGCLDDHSAGSDMEKRWDFNGDGHWDTPFVKEMEFYHQYSTPGQYLAILQIKDEGGLTDDIAKQINISSSQNITGFFRDERDSKLYGTVKIGDKWWMSENMDYRPLDKMQIPMLQKCYDEDDKNCDKYGSLYLVERAYDFDKRGIGVCPKGWRLPSRREMDEMVDQLPRENTREALQAGGSSGLDLIFPGHGKFQFVYSPVDPTRIIDTVWYYYKKDEENYTISSDYTYASGKVYTLQLTKKSSELWMWKYPAKNNYYSIRCVKD